MNPCEKTRGFTLVELTIAVTISTIIIILISTTFGLGQKTFRESSAQAELTQNGRVVLDLMSRDLRRAKAIVTSLPINSSDPQTIAHELEFEDGGVSSQIQYIRYYLTNYDIYRQIVVYFFETDPETYVHYGDTDAFGLPESTTTEDRIIGENFSGLDFYGQGNINIDLTLQKNGKEMEMKLIINPRNI